MKCFFTVSYVVSEYTCARKIQSPTGKEGKLFCLVLVKRRMTCCQSNPLGHLIGLESYPNSGGATSVKASSPWGCECKVGGMDLGPLFFCTFELIWKNSMPTYRDDPKGTENTFNLFFFFSLAISSLTWGDVQSVLNTLLTSEKCRIVQDKAQKDFSDGLLQKPLVTQLGLQQV